MQPDGCLEHLGRKDFQIKVRGNRVEVEMVEAALLRSGLVLEAAVTATHTDSDAEPRIVAYIVSATDPPPSVGALRAALAHLPASTRPAEFVLCDALPLGENGKVDARALATGPRTRPLLDAELAPARSHLEAELVAIWEELLQVRPVGVHDPFDELGGDSLLAATLLTGIEEKLCRELPFWLIARNRTIEELARAIEGEAPALDEPIVELAPRNGDLLPFFFAHGDYAGGALYCSRLAKSLEPRGFYAIAPHGLHGGAVPTTVEAMAAERVAALRELFPQGPYLLGGHCNPGGLVALEMARQLRAEGVPAALVLIGTTPPNARRGILPTARALRAGIRLGSRAARLPDERAERLFWLARSLATRIAEAGSPPQPPDPRTVGTRDAWSRAVGSYLAPRYAGPVALLWPEDDRFDADEAVRRWRRVGVEPETRVVPGDHLTVVTRHLGATAEALERALASSERQLRRT
jgi:thioesterase domain-containing protein/acyl carrier protein